MSVFKRAVCCGIYGLALHITPAAACELTVAAASSLTQPFKRIAADFQKNTGCNIALHFAASGVLVQQLTHGAPFDVLASADQLSMDKAVVAGLVLPQSRHNFIQNRLVLISKANAPQNLSLQQLLDSPTSQLAIGQPTSVPAGRYAQQVMQSMGIWQDATKHLIHAANVKQVLDFVSREEVDAGFVYASDAFGQAVTVLQPIETPEPIRYPIAVTTQSEHTALAKQFADYVVSSAGQQTLLSFGFIELTAP